MKFYIDTITLWLKNNKIRTLKFKSNKVNIITGASGTGKSEIMSIIDYCFFSSSAAISEEKINENVEWYGLTFYINDKCFTVARQKIIKRRGSLNYYYSSIGKIPKMPESNISEDGLKEVIQAEFSINSNLVIPYSGKSIKAGNRISFRYFLLFNTQSGNTISNDEVYFDKQNVTRYREALERIFDIALKIEDIENILIKEKIITLEKDIAKIQKKQSIYDKEEELFDSNIRNEIKQARILNLINDQYIEPEHYLPILHNLVSKQNLQEISNSFLEIDELNKSRTDLIRKIRNYNRLHKQYLDYINIEKNNFDSLKPIEYVKENFRELLLLPETATLLEDLESEFNMIKKEINNKKPFKLNIEEEVKILKQELSEVEEKIKQYPQQEDFVNVKTETEKILFLGELKYKLSLYENKTNKEDFSEELKKKEEELLKLKKLVRDEKVDREAFKSMLETLIQNYLDKVGSALGVYEGYRALFNFKDKSLSLRPADSIYPAHVGSSSNHLFMHLCLFLGLHEASIIQQSPYIAQFMILDQPSRPYYGEEEDNWSKVDVSDKGKITTAMRLLDEFISHINQKYNEEFQFIVLEHIPTGVWNGMKNFHLVEEFRYGNALINED
jgi:energy-coupling factor transporter ATP-binding protein EcfA2